MKNNIILKVICIVFFLIVLFAACSIPFYFESPSMFYKTGIDKLLLRTGKIFGIIAAGLLLFQPVFIGRFSFLDKVFTTKKLFQIHRITGLILLGFALVHPLLILGADHFVFFPFENKYWPEFVGVCLLPLLFLFIVVSFWQKGIGLNYKSWHMLHRIFSPIVLILMFIHVFKVSRSFESGLPYYALVVSFVLIFFLFARKYLR
jgi:predicted ferric reductase